MSQSCGGGGGRTQSQEQQSELRESDAETLHESGVADE